MRILVACEYSGTVRDAFLEKGHDAVSCDLRPTESPGPHIKGDVMTVLEDGWDMMIAHPPCTYLANSGVRWLYEQETRWKDMIWGAVFFRNLLEAPIPRICVENPVVHRYARLIIGRSHDQTIQPYEFGHDASKRTCLWLKGLPPLQPTNIIEKERYANQTPSGQNKLGPSPDRGKKRSKFYEGVAKAMAEQWT